MFKQLNRTKTMIVTILGFILISVGDASANDNLSSAQQLDNQIESAKNIKLVEKFFSFSTSYDIVIDGKVIGHIKGDFYHPFGDDLKIQTLSGTTIYSEHQQRRLLNLSITRGGVFVNQDNQPDGAIREELFMLFSHQFKIFDQDGNHVGRSYQDPWHFFSTYYKVVNKKNQTLVSGKAESLHVTTQIKVRRLSSSKTVSMKQALLIMTIEEAITEANSDND